MNPLRAVIFDLDGTLAGTFPLIIASWNASVGEATGRVWPRDEILSRFGTPEEMMIRRELGEPAWRAAYKKFHAFYEANHHQAVIFDGIPEVLAALKAMGLKLGVATGKGALSAGIAVRLWGWQTVFEAVVNGSDVAAQKPAPDMLLLAARRLNAEPRHCVMIGDSPVDVKAGRAAGMRTIAAAWHTAYAEELQAARPDFTAARPQDLLPVLTAIGGVRQ